MAKTTKKKSTTKPPTKAKSSTKRTTSSASNNSSADPEREPELETLISKNGSADDEQPNSRTATPARK